MATQKSNPVFDYVAQAGRTAAANTQAAIDVSKQMDDQAAAFETAIVQASALGNARQTIVAQEESFKAATDAQVSKINTELGADPTKQGTEANFWAKEMQANADKAYAARDVISEKKSKSFLTDPLGFIEAQFTLDSDIEAYNYYADKHNMAEDNLKNTIAISDSAVIAAERSKQTTSTELAIAKGEEAASLAAINVAELKSKAAGTRIQGLTELNNFSNKDLQIAFQVHSAQNADASLKLQQEQAAYQREMRDLARKDAQAKLEDKAAQLDAVKYEMEAYNAGARRTGKLTFSDPKMFLTAYKANVNTPEFMNTLGSGKLVMLNEGKTSGIMVADTPGEAALIYGSGQANATIGPVGQFLKDRLVEVKQMPNAPKDKAALAGVVTEQALIESARQLKRIDDKKPNIYAAPPMAVVLGSKAFQDDPFVATVLRPMLDASPNATVKDSTIIEQAVDFAKVDPRGNFNLAADSIARYYKNAVLINATTNQYKENGLPDQKNYPAVIDGAIVDLSDATAVKMLLLKKGWSAADATAAKLTGIYRPAK